MSTETTPTLDAEDLSFVDSFQAMMQGAPKAEPEITQAQEPVTVKPVTVEDPIKDIESDDLKDDDILKLPTDDIEEKTEVVDSEDADNPYKAGSPQHTRFREMRKEAATLKSQLDTETQTRAQTEAKLKEYEAKVNRADELEAKIKEYEAKMTVTNIQESAAYQEAVAKPLQEILNRSDALAERTGIDPDELASALEISDDKQRRVRFKELTSGLDLDPDDVYEMRVLAEKVQPLKAKRQEILENADTALAELEASRVKQQEVETLKAAEARKLTVDQVAERLTSKIPFLKSMDGVDLESVIAEAKNTDPNIVPDHLKAYNSIAGQLLPKFIREYGKLTRQVEELSDDLSTYRKQTPRLTPDSGGLRDSSTDEEEGLVDRYKRQFGG